MEAALRKGRQLPQWYLDEPPRHPVLDDFYLAAFWALSSMRNYDSGPIPWDRIVIYGKHVGLDDSLTERLVVVIRAMDKDYLEWAAAEAKKRRGK